MITQESSGVVAMDKIRENINRKPFDILTEYAPKLQAAGMQTSAIASSVNEIVDDYKPQIDADDVLENIIAKLEDDKKKYLEKVSKNKLTCLPPRRLVINKQRLSNNACTAQPGLRVRFVYADNPNEYVHYGVVYYWLYKKKKEKS